MFDSCHRAPLYRAQSTQTQTTQGPQDRGAGSTHVAGYGSLAPQAVRYVRSSHRTVRKKRFRAMEFRVVAVREVGFGFIATYRDYIIPKHIPQVTGGIRPPKHPNHRTSGGWARSPIGRTPGGLRCATPCRFGSASDSSSLCGKWHMTRTGTTGAPFLQGYKPSRLQVEVDSVRAICAMEGLVDKV